MADPDRAIARVDDINPCLQSRLRGQRRDEVSAVEAASWLDEAGVLKDSSSRPGLPLRKLLRAGRIQGAEQRPPASHGRWYIRRVDGAVADERQPGVKVELIIQPELPRARTAARRGHQRCTRRTRDA